MTGIRNVHEDRVVGMGGATWRARLRPCRLPGFADLQAGLGGESTAAAKPFAHHRLVVRDQAARGPGPGSVHAATAERGAHQR